MWVRMRPPQPDEADVDAIVGADDAALRQRPLRGRAGMFAGRRGHGARAEQLDEVPPCLLMHTCLLESASRIALRRASVHANARQSAESRVICDA